VCHRRITREDDYPTKSFVEEEEGQKIDEGEVQSQVKEIDLHLLGLKSELGGVVCVLEGEELDVVDASRSPDIQRHGPHEEQEDEISKTDEDRKSWILGTEGVGVGWGEFRTCRRGARGDQTIQMS
jgi:hypothetical protein